MEKIQVVKTSTVWTDVVIIYVILIELCMTFDPYVCFKGNNSCKTYAFRIKVGNVQMVYLVSFHISYILSTKY